jgi:hypothetical protein
MTPLILCNSNGMYIPIDYPAVSTPGSVKLDRSCSRPEGLHGGFECCVHSRIWKGHNPCWSGSCPSNITVFDLVPFVGQYGLKRTTSLKPHDLEGPMERFGAVVDLGNYQKRAEGVGATSSQHQEVFWLRSRNSVCSYGLIAKTERGVRERRGPRCYPGQKDLVDRLGKEAKTQRHNVAGR